MSGKVLVKLQESKHISVIGDAGAGKSTYLRNMVKGALKHNPELQVYVYGARDSKWEDFEKMGLITLYSFEGTIKNQLLDEVYPNSDKDMLIVVDDIEFTLQMLPRDKQAEVTTKIYDLLIGENSENTYSIVSSQRPIASYMPEDILKLANTKIALKVTNESDYNSFFDDKSYKATGSKPTEVAEAYIDTKNTNGAVFIDNSNEIDLR